MKNIIKAGLLIFILSSVAYLVLKQSNATFSNISALKVAPSEKTNQRKETLQAYYFHGSKRCNTCQRIEALTEETLEKHFGTELKSKRILFQSINTDLPENEHYINDYSLNGSSLVLIHFNKGKLISSKTLNKLWYFVGDKSKFEKYIQTEVRELLKD